MTDLLEPLAEQLAGWHVPGLQVTAVADGEVVVAGGVGVRGADDPEPVGPQTLFQHGSCGKAYTGLLAAVLAADGVVDLDAPVRRHVPELRLADEHAAERITLRDLLSHRSGLGRHDLIWILSPHLGRDALVRRLEFLPLSSDPRTRWEYSNLGFTLAGHVLGRAAGSSWEDQLRQRVLAPLGMRRTFTAYDAVPADDVARPHLLQDDKARETAVRRLDGAAPAGQLVTCADDAARWLLLQAGEPLLSQDAVRVSHSAAALLPEGLMPYAELDLHGYALGWCVGTYRGRRVRWHSGGVDGYATQTIVLPEQRIGVTASANLHGSQLPMAAILHLADRLLGERPAASWFDRVRAENVDEDAPDRPVHHDAPPAHELAGYTGSYAHPAYGELVATVVDGRLAVRIGEADLRTVHRHFETWDLHYAPLEVDLPVTFAADPNGVVAEAVVPLDAASLPIRFVRT